MLLEVKLEAWLPECLSLILLECSNPKIQSSRSPIHYLTHPILFKVLQLTCSPASRLFILHFAGHFTYGSQLLTEHLLATSRCMMISNYDLVPLNPLTDLICKQDFVCRTTFI